MIMSWRSAASVLLPCSAVLVVWASFAEATPCLPSASAVRQDYPGAWASWTLRAEGHEGVKCWYPASRPAAQNNRDETPGRANTSGGAPVLAARPQTRVLPAAAAQTDGLGSDLPSRETLSGADVAAEESSFAERFAAVFEQRFLGGASLKERIAELVDGLRTPDQAAPDGNPRGLGFDNREDAR
jgi:hypothetical protein